jgi:hypothetical protein
VSQLLKRAAVKTIKPVVSDRAWAAIKARVGSVPTSVPEPDEALTPAQRRLREKLLAMDLTQLAKHFKTDKAGRHHYTQHYERHLGHLRGDVFTLLEIGVGGYARENQGGNSLRMWKQYFGNAQIVGLDIEDKSFLEGPRIRIYQGSQTDAELLRRIVDQVGPVKVVVDDGSHRPEHIRETFRVLFPLLHKEGIYAIEDTQTSYWPSFGGSTDLQSRDTTMALVKDLLDGLNYEEFEDDGYEPSYSDRHVIAVHAYHNLVIIEKGLNNEGSTGRKR